METGWSASRSRSRVSALPTISSTGCQSRARRAAPDCRRARSRTFATTSLMCRASPAIEAASSARTAGVRASPLSASVEDAPTMAASGVRSSCEIAASRALRTDSVSAASRAARAASARRTRCSATATWLAKLCSRRRCSGTKTRRALAGSSAITPTVCSPIDERHVERVGARRACRCPGRPAARGRGPTARCRGRRRAAIPARRAPSAAGCARRVGQQHGHLAREDATPGGAPRSRAGRRARRRRRAPRPSRASAVARSSRWPAMLACRRTLCDQRAR